ncbi:protein WHAT'S THIS FACTOR 1 homolog, chloroplastic [Rhodamnia argentea]|uniref:Protein WHAT'S THIS FACTOR 1 homolog, chloroplastic n=1 Tax=Rhodamnia argentea TaxID=178133 RepID=A0A8B8P6N1_9MYRT|nr:protein WHAT'S THIS FACTOR 1 homolog, chloroplastic [Rhodamnia argentea]
MTRLQFVFESVASSNEWSATRQCGCIVTSLVRLPTLRRNWSLGEVLFNCLQRRFMTTSKRVQDRSKNKRVHHLEIATEKHKVVSKVLVLMEMLKKEPEMIIPVRSVDRYRQQINLPKPHSIVDFIRKSPKLFELYKDQKGVLWCGMTKEGEDLLEEEERLIREHSGMAAEYVTRMLMMSVDKRLPLDKIAHFRREFGLPADFRSKWVHEYPQHFKVVKSPDEVDYLELVEWNPAWAITELEKSVLGGSESVSRTPGLLSLSFPLKFPAGYKKVYRYGGKIEHFQKRSYLSPYADARGLQAGSKEFDKRAVAVMHELLSFTMEKRLVTDHLTHFRREFMMPQKLMRLLLKHLGIFYVSERGKRFSVFLTGAYEGVELIQKCPLVIWKEKVLSLIGYRGRKKKIETFTDLSDMEDNGVLEGGSEDEGIPMQLDQGESISELKDIAMGDSPFMDISEIDNVYRPDDSF